MTVTVLPTRTTSQWSDACTALHESVIAADHPRVDEHAATAALLLLEAGCPTQAWADRMAAIAVIADRRSDIAPTAGRRVAYREAALAALTMLDLAQHLHRTRPSDDAVAALQQTGLRTAAAQGF